MDENPYKSPEVPAVHTTARDATIKQLRRMTLVGFSLGGIAAGSLFLAPLVRWAGAVGDPGGHSIGGGLGGFIGLAIACMINASRTRQKPAV